MWVADDRHRRQRIGTALLFLSRRDEDLNVRGAYLHMVADAAVSGAVVLAALAIRYTGTRRGSIR